MEVFAYILAVIMIASTVFAIFHIIEDDARVRRNTRIPKGSTTPSSLPRPSQYLNDPRPGD